MATQNRRDIVIIGGGIGGLTLALNLHAVGLGARVQVCETVPEIRAVGGGINLGPHAIRVLSELGLQPALALRGVQPQDYAFFTRHGQLVYREPWGLAAGHKWPHFSLHRADLHEVLLNAVAERLGPDAVLVDHRCAGLTPDADGVTVHLTDSAGKARPDIRAGIVIGCDGVHSAVRKHLYPDEGPPRYHGINLWRGIARHKPLLTGASIVRIGAMHSTLIVYPIRQDLDEQGRQLMNWVAEVDGEIAAVADWNAQGKLEDFLPVYQDWNFGWIDVPELFKSTDPILSYPMVDRDPLDRWTFDRVTLLGDAAHPMFPRGGNGGAQAILDTVSLARHLASNIGDVAALSAYEDERRPATSKVVLQNRTAPPNLIVDTVEKRTGGKPFNSLEEVVTQDELKTIFANYQKVAGYHVDLVNKQGSTK